MPKLSVDEWKENLVENENGKKDYLVGKKIPHTADTDSLDRCGS